MATTAHCIFCFETLASKLEDRASLSLTEVESLWKEYIEANKPETPEIPETVDEDQTEDQKSAKAADEYPIFVTWDTKSTSGTKRLRGCKGTFTAAPLSEQLESFALIAALEDHRFKPIVQAELSRLTCGVTILHSFQPVDDPLGWKLGQHGIRVSFRDDSGKRYGATFLPDVAVEQGWTQEDAIEHAVSKAGWRGDVDDVKSLKVTTYEGWKANIRYDGFLEWRLWLEESGNE